MLHHWLTVYIPISTFHLQHRFFPPLPNKLKYMITSIEMASTPDDTNTIFASFVWARSMHAMSLRGKSACTVSFFLWKKLRSRLSLFLRKEGQPSASRDSGPTAAEARRRMKLVVASGRWVREGPPPFNARRPRTRVSCWIVTMRSFWHHQIQRLVLCWVMPSKSRRCLRARKLRLNPLNPLALHMTSYWRLWTIK